MINGKIHNGMNTIQNNTIESLAIFNLSVLSRSMQANCDLSDLYNIFVIHIF